MFSIRPAVHGDIDSICGFDDIAQHDSQRRAFIHHSVDAGICSVVTTSAEQIIGYGVLEYSFYEQGFVSMLYIHPEYRRRDAGSMLMHHFESICRTAKLFTSTNLSNLPMQSLLAKSGYILSGVIHHLDENDPELVFVKLLSTYNRGGKPT